jgi:hypothetical protein
MSKDGSPSLDQTVQAQIPVPIATYPLTSLYQNHFPPVSSCDPSSIWSHSKPGWHGNDTQAQLGTAQLGWGE